MYEENPKEITILENIYGTLFYPSETFERLKNNPPLIEGLAIVAGISILSPLLNFSNFTAMNAGWFLFKLIGAGFTGVIFWLFYALFIELIASVFKHGGRAKIFLTLSAFALLPWMFLPSAGLLKGENVFTGLLGIFIGLCAWIWTTMLSIFAVMKSYEITSGRILIILSLPFLGSILALAWFIGFITTLSGILKI